MLCRPFSEAHLEEEITEDNILQNHVEETPRLLLRVDGPTTFEVIPTGNICSFLINPKNQLLLFNQENRNVI